MNAFKEVNENGDLYGSEAEKNWATTLRRDMAMRLDLLGWNGIENIVTKFAKPSDFSGIPKTEKSEMAKNLILKIVKNIIERKIAHNWIKDRSKKTEEMIERAYAEVIEEHKRLKKAL